MKHHERRVLPRLVLAGRIASHRVRLRRGENSLLKRLGPGLITGASDDDPSGIATYSQAGAQFGYAMCWVMLFVFPLMAAIQEISARIGRVTGHGIAGAIRAHYSQTLLRVMVALLLVANIINLAADLGAMGDAVRLLIGGPGQLYVVALAVFCTLLEVLSRYDRYVAVLKWFSLSLLSYVAATLALDVPWRQVAWHTLVPTLSLRPDYITAIVAVLGTTITPYCFFWQSSQEAEDERITPTAHPLLEAPEEAAREISRIRFDTYVGMAYSNVISIFIIVCTGATLNASGVTDIQTSSQAAEALRPIAGEFAFALFAMGIIGIGMLAVPVLAGSCAYAVGEALGWTVGLSRNVLDAKAFYGTVAAATLTGIVGNLVGMDPIRALFWAAVINGVVAVPLMTVMMVMASSPRVMGPFTLPRPLWALGWTCTLAMAVAVAGMLATW